MRKAFDAVEQQPHPTEDTIHQVLRQVRDVAGITPKDVIRNVDGVRLALGTFHLVSTLAKCAFPMWSENEFGSCRAIGGFGDGQLRLTFRARRHCRKRPGIGCFALSCDRFRLGAASGECLSRICTARLGFLRILKVQRGRGREGKYCFSSEVLALHAYWVVVLDEMAGVNGANAGSPVQRLTTGKPPGDRSAAPTGAVITSDLVINNERKGQTFLAENVATPINAGGVGILLIHLDRIVRVNAIEVVPKEQQRHQYRYSKV
ncbi:hypothetical protein KC361_g100 [Hortaea werneckii]|nr:hypothetical protein KC361_g100 [Hortaea werneckii]